MEETIKTEKKIQILLSTYNGEKYLREQLDSFLALDVYDQCCVLIRDDGSSDDTCRILQTYAEQYGFQVEFGDHIGTNASYQWLLENSDSHCVYFAFSDQDDVWMKDKLSIALQKLSHHSQENLLLFASRSQIVDEALNPIGKSINPNRGTSFYNAMVQNVLPGHTQVFNAALRDDLKKHGIMNAHVVDWWLYLVASAKGEVLFSDVCSVLHRQHGRNAVGYRLGFLPSIQKKLRYIREGKGNSISLQLKNFLCIYQGEISAEFEHEVKLYLGGSGSLLRRIGYLRRKKAYRQRVHEDFAFCCLYLLGKYDC